MACGTLWVPVLEGEARDPSLRNTQVLGEDRHSCEEWPSNVCWLHRADESQGQWKWPNPWEAPKKLPPGLKEETEGSGASGTGEGRAFEDEEHHVLPAREEHGNSPVRIEWRLCRVLGAAKRRIQRQAGPDDKGSGVSIRRAGLHPSVRELLENGKQRTEGGESVLGCARPCSRGLALECCHSANA